MRSVSRERCLSPKGGSFPDSDAAKGDSCKGSISERTEPGSTKDRGQGEPPRKRSHGLFRECPPSLRKDTSQCLPRKITEVLQPSPVPFPFLNGSSCRAYPVPLLPQWIGCVRDSLFTFLVLDPDVMQRPCDITQRSWTPSWRPCWKGAFPRRVTEVLCWKEGGFSFLSHMLR